MFKFSYKSESNVIIVTHSGAFDIEQLHKLKYVLNADFHELTEVNILLDYRNTKFIVTDNTFALEVAELIDMIPNETDQSPPLRIACLPGNAENRMVNQLYEIMTAEIEDYDYKLFDSYEEALSWLENRL